MAETFMRNSTPAWVPRAKPSLSTETVLRWVVFDDAESLREADLTNLDLAGAQLWGADFRHCNMRGCNFAGANLTGTDFRNADVRDCNFENVYLGRTHLAGATYNENTRFPHNFDPVESSMLFVGKDV